VQELRAQQTRNIGRMRGMGRERFTSAYVNGFFSFHVKEIADAFDLGKDPAE
jgi:hypothetical protein